MPTAEQHLQQMDTFASNSNAPPEIEIDAHCHCFNGRDMPIVGFLEHLISEYPFFVLVAPFALLLARIIEDAAPNYAKEYKLLRKLVRRPSALKLVKRNSDRKQELIVRGLRKFIDKDTSFGRAASKERALTAENDAFIIYLYRLFGIPVLTQPGKNKAGIRNGLVGNAPELAQRILQNRQIQGLEKSIAYVRQFHILATEMTNYRFQILDDLAVRYGSPHTKLRVLTPAIVDLEYWLPHADKPTKVNQQAELLELISLIQPVGRIAHGFIAFDPWRYWDDVLDRRSPNAFEVVKTAVEKRGFFGVKLYPPMGFRAYDNASLPNKEFPSKLRKLFRRRTEIGRKIDEALLQLYDYCHKNQVPIMAHCANSIGSHPDYALRAAPDYWRLVLEKYPDLRLNLGHFGGIWDFASALPIKVPEDTSNTPKLWPCQIAAMIEKYDNLYVDVGDFAAVMERWDEGQNTQKIFSNLATLAENYSKLKSRVMYGTDWALLDREPGNERYYQAMRDHFARIFGATDDILGKNAAAFLGLHRNQRTRARLESFYRDNNLPSPILTTDEWVDA
jgi:predicted TIM-barrel fold metal-dependent hydrolase